VLDKGAFENQYNEEGFKRSIERYYFWMVLSTFRQTRKMLKKSQSLHLSNLATKLDNLALYILIVKEGFKSHHSEVLLLDGPFNF
jgi:hypothetical protein